MSKFISLLFMMLFAVGASAQSIQVVVDFEDDMDTDQISIIEDEYGIDLVQNSPMFGKTKIMILDVDSSALEKTLDSLRDIPEVENVGINAIFKIPEARSDILLKADYGEPEGPFPNDPLFRKHQWNFKMVGAKKAWRSSTGEGVIVAVIDTGVSNGKGRFPRVPDLAQTDIVPGFNFVDDSADPSDGNGHGTHVAGTIAQSTNNGIGVAGLAYNAKIMPVKVLADEGWGTVADIAEGIIWAVDNGAHVINLSLGGGGHSDLLESAVDYARNNNVFVACAAGNAGKPVIEYPASYNSCMAISSVGKAGELAFYSSYGEGQDSSHNGVFVAAPGGDQKADGQEGGVWQDTIASDNPEAHGYFPLQGTSMATPHVAAVAALVMSAMGPDSYDVSDVEDIISKTATPKNDEFKYGAGIVNAEMAVKKASESSDSNIFELILGFMIGAVALSAVRLLD